MKNGRVEHDEWFLPPPFFPKILRNMDRGLYDRRHLRPMFGEESLRLLWVNRQTLMVSWFALLIGCACVFTWSQAGGASVKRPPLINHVPAIAVFSVLGAKALALETARVVAVGQACGALKSRSQVTPRIQCCWARRKRSSSLYIFWGGAGGGRKNIWSVLVLVFCWLFCYKEVNMVGTW